MAINNGKLTLSHEQSLREQLDDIATCLGDFRVSTRGRDIGMLCTSPKVNKLAKNRPFEKHDFGAMGTFNMYGIQSESDRKSHAYGYYWFPDRDNEDLIPFAPYPLNLIYKAKGLYGEWTSKPLSIYRVWDFDGYNHNAKIPYEYIITGADAEQKRLCSVQSLEGDDYEAGISLSDMPHPDISHYTKDWLDWHIVTIANWAAPLGVATEDHFRVSDTGLTVRDLDNPSNVISTEITLPFNGTDEVREYDVIWAVTSNDDISGDTLGQWIFLPQSLRKIQHKAGYTVRWNTAGWKFDAVSNMDGVVTKITLKLESINNLPYPIFFGVSLDIWEKGKDISSGYRAGFIVGLEDSNMELEVSNLNTFLSFTPKFENTMLALTFDPRNADTFEEVSPITHFNPKNDCLEEGEAKTEDGYTIQEFRLYTPL